MKTRLITAAIVATFAAWAPSSMARETVTIDGIVGAEGVLNGVDTQTAGTLTVGNNQNINTNNDPGGAITSDGNNTASIVFTGNSTLTGFVGTNGIRFLSISAGANASTVTFNGNVFSTAFSVSGTGTVNFNGNTLAAAGANFVNDGFINLGAGRVFTGAITTNTANTGTLTLNNGSSVTGAIGGANGLRQINVPNGNAAVTGAVQAQGFSLGTNTLSINGALTPNAGASIATTFASNAVFGNIAVTGNSNVTSVITVVPTGSAALTVGTTYMIVNGTAGGTVGTVVNVVNPNPLFTFTGVPINADGDVRITLVAMTPLAAVIPLPAADVLGTPATPGSDLATVQNAIFALPSIADIAAAVLQLSPSSTNLAAPWVASQVTRQFEDLWMARAEEIQDLCCDSCDLDQSTNDKSANTHKCQGAEKHSNWWVKGFGREGNQGDRRNLFGYDSDAYGVMLGYDKPLNEQTYAGVGVGYARNDIDGTHDSDNTQVDSYQATAYVGYTPGPWFVQGAVVAGLDIYDGERDIVFPGIDRRAEADYTGQQYSGLVTLGTHLSNDRGFTVTPTASLQYTHVRVGDYREHGAGDVNLRINSQNYDFVQSGLGVKAESVIKSGRGTISPEMHVKWLHDFNSTTMEQRAEFTGLAGKFKTEGVDQDRDMYNIGAGITFLSCNCNQTSWSVKGLYDFKWNESDYTSHQLSVIAGMNF